MQKIQHSPFLHHPVIPAPSRHSCESRNPAPPSFLRHPVIPAKAGTQPLRHSCTIPSFLRKQESSKTHKPQGFTTYKGVSRVQSLKRQCKKSNTRHSCATLSFLHHPVIPAKAGTQPLRHSCESRNPAPPPFLHHPVIPAKAGIQ